MVSNASDDLPDPDRPVMTTSASRGRDSEMSRRLCSRAPEMTIEFLFGVIRPPVYVPEQTFARQCSRTLRRRREVGADRVSAVSPHRRPEGGERGLVAQAPVGPLRPQARVVEGVLRVAVDGRPRVPEDPPEPEGRPRAQVQ